jgi:hypothetical protein
MFVRQKRFFHIMCGCALFFFLGWFFLFCHNILVESIMFVADCGMLDLTGGAGRIYLLSKP